MFEVLRFEFTVRVGKAEEKKEYKICVGKILVWGIIVVSLALAGDVGPVKSLLLRALAK